MRWARPAGKRLTCACRPFSIRTRPPGVKVADVEVKQVDMPESMLRAMAKQPEAEREKRSKIIHAEDEFSAAQRLVRCRPALAHGTGQAVQLRYLQTLSEIGMQKFPPSPSRRLDCTASAAGRLFSE
jgi:hypothetical protein